MPESLRIFLVEDHDDEALVIRRTLERAGHQVARCRTAADALIVLGNGTYQLILIKHLLMPHDLTGLDLLRSVKLEGITAPVMFVTGPGDEKIAAEALRAGAIDYIIKDAALAFLADLPRKAQESVQRHRLLDRNRLLTDALESARDGIAVTDLQGNFQHVNRALEAMSGYTRQELLRGNVRLFKSGVHAPAFFAEIWRTILARSSWQGELTNRRKDGTFADISLTISPLLDSQGALTHFVAIYRDISERKLLERQLIQAEKMQSVGTLAGGVAHEFNNLLAGMQGYAALALREPGANDTVREFLQLIVHLSDRAANLTRALLAYARKPSLTRQPTPMVRLMTQCADLVRQTLAVEVQLDLPPESTSDLQALADGNQLQQVLINLALNARDSLPAPRPILFRLRQQSLARELLCFPDKVPPGEYLVLQVIDQGIGMTPEVLNQALNPFFTTKDVGQGTGLGLPVAFGIIHAHQGFLALDSGPDRGTTVSVYLPQFTQPVAAPRPASEDGTTIEPEKVRSRSILVVDDEEAVLDVVRRFLEIAGHQVTCAATGEEALRHLDEGKRIDLVVLDVLIPREEETQTFLRLRQRHPQLPIVLCTALMQGDPFPKVFQEEAAGLLRKPFRMSELWQAVNQALSSGV